MSDTPLISLIVPTRGRPGQLRAFLDSVAATADAPGNVEVVLVIDADDPGSLRVTGGRLRVRPVLVLPGLTMGALNNAGCEAASGQYLMLLNDDVLARTPGWDTRLRACFGCCPDDILLVHVNDTLMRTALCTFPVVTRTFCDLAGGICPPAYRRYRIDDHIEDVFNFLGLLGEYRSVYLPDVVFEHANYRETADGLRQYFADDAGLALDAPLYDELLPARKELAVRLKAYIEGRAVTAREGEWRRRLEAVADPFALRVPERLHVAEDFSRKGLAGLRAGLRGRPPAKPRTGPPTLRERFDEAGACLRRAGYAGLGRLVWGKVRAKVRHVTGRVRGA